MWALQNNREKVRLWITQVCRDGCEIKRAREYCLTPAASARSKENNLCEGEAAHPLNVGASQMRR